MTSPVLDVRDLRVTLATDAGDVSAVCGVSFHVDAGETLALVGESGAGKSLTALALMRLCGKGASGHGARLEGNVSLRSENGEVARLLEIPLDAMRLLRGRAISMVFQEPMTSLNPVFRVGWQIAEALVTHEGLTWAAAEKRAEEMMALVGIPDPSTRKRSFPHELSGGMRQRVMIAMALACRPRLLIADEPTTALDVTVQAQVLELLRTLQREMGMAVLFITHDLGVVAQIADRVAVMYAGRIVEEAPVRDLFAHPRHPYTAGLLRSMPNPAGATPGAMVQPIPGSMPNVRRLPPGCSFSARCASSDPARCTASIPELEAAGEARTVRCVRWRELVETAKATA